MNAFAHLEYREFETAPELRRFVISGCDVRAKTAAAELRILPDACDYLVWDSKRGLQILAGSREHFEYAGLEPGARITALKMRPGALAAVLGRDARDFAGPGPVSMIDAGIPRASPQGDVFRRFEENPQANHGSLDRLLIDVLRARQYSPGIDADPGESPPLPTRVAGLLDANPGATIGELARGCGLTLRTFERRLRASCGLSPTRLRSILRFFQSYLMLSRFPAGRLTDVAYSSGYADQAHFIRDFRRFAGVRPGDARRQPARWGLHPAPRSKHRLIQER